MRPQTVAVTSATTSPALPMDWRLNPFSVGFGVIVSGTLTYKVQHSFDGTNWFDHSSVVNLTASADGNYAFPVLQIRLNVTAFTSGSATLTLIQGG